LEIAAERGLKSIAFPAISTGVYGFPPERAARIAVKTVRDFLAGHDQPRKVIFCCFGKESAEAHRVAFANP
jgi:O-acetyl-ADP-ribose deacetylase (regulator of RNase III)